MIGEGMIFRSVELSDLDKVADQFLKHLDKFRVWLFYGEMGAGKTTLIKAICKAIGVEDTMSSPTFAIVNEYEKPDHSSVFHFDFYRIKSEAEAYDIGTDEYFYSGSTCFIEWPEKIPSLIPAQYGKVTIQADNQRQRTIVISIHDGKEENGF